VTGVTEEERAARWRAQRTAQLEARRDRAAALAGDPVAYAQLKAAWAPLFAFLRDPEAWQT
jgi:hypothetical protein